MLIDWSERIRQSHVASISDEKQSRRQRILQFGHENDGLKKGNIFGELQGLLTLENPPE